MADRPEADPKRDFTRLAPELRAALVAELAAVVERAKDLTPDEAAVLRHILAFAGYSRDGGLFVPSFAVLWGEEASYIPAVPLPAARVRAASATLRRRGVLRDLAWTARLDSQAHTDGVFVESEALRELAAGAAAPKRKVILFIAASVDGYIARKDGDTSFLSRVEAPPEDYGYAEFLKTVDTVIMGRKTYEKAHGFPEFPHRGRRVIVLSRKKKGRDAHAEFKSGDLTKLIAKLRKEPGGDVFCDGGAETVHALLKKNLIDSLVVSLVPVLLGDGVPLFKKGRPETRLRLVSSRDFPTGLVQLRYERA